MNDDVNRKDVSPGEAEQKETLFEFLRSWPSFEIPERLKDDARAEAFDIEEE